ncbi:orotate phosphoribosyltransferase [Fulvivirga sp. 2943]|uniref:Orotate phosphoribosyltransferase n=1 Tax=Fulvivirga sediminis TaxID=2803949 RepID=A0A937F5M6_9BACT|nr:orotate phosphoribosyltransferase [Fulvivirga sediminis]
MGYTIAAKLLDIEAIKLNLDNPFTWSSGWKSPIYCDNRLSLSYPETRTLIKQALASTIKKNYPSVEAIAGVATAGIPQGALVAEELGVPFIYVRSKPKGHGMENMIEGKITEEQKVVVIEDLVSTGGSSLKAVEALREAKMEVLGMAAIFTYGFDVADENFENADVSLVCLSNYGLLIEEALKRGYVSDDQIESLKEWRNNPGSWKQ